MKALIPVEVIEQRILLIRGQRVMLDADMAGLYGTTTKRLNEQVKRNRNRFPEDFMFQLIMEEARIWRTEVRGGGLRSQIVTLKRGQHVKYRPYAFTEHGILGIKSFIQDLQETCRTASENTMQVECLQQRKEVPLSLFIMKHV